MANLPVRGAGKRVLKSKKEVQDLLKQSAKTIVARIGDDMVKTLKHYTAMNLYEKMQPGERYDRSGGYYNSIKRTPSSSGDGLYMSNIGYDIGYLRSHQSQPVYRESRTGKRYMVKFGRYTDVYGAFVGDIMVEKGWLEQGTKGGGSEDGEGRNLHPRRGAYAERQSRRWLEKYLAKREIDMNLSEYGFEYGNITISKHKKMPR